MIDIKNYVDDKLSEITVSSALSKAILDQTIERKSGRRRPFTRRWIVAAVAISLVLTCSFTAFASSVPALNDWLYRLNPQLAEYLYPIQKSDTDNGIKVEVLSAINDNHNAVVYFTVQDLTDQNRVDEKLDLCDTCDIEGPCIFNIKLISYNPDTKTALFAMRGSGGEGMSNQMTTFKISQFMSGKKIYEWFDTGIQLEALAKNKVKSLPISEFDDNYGSDLSKGGLDVLEPDVMRLPLGNGIDFVTISNLGFVDGKLHIQTKWETSFDNHGDFRLTKETKAGNVRETEPGYSNYYFRTEEDIAACGHNRFTKHIEYVFDVSKEELKDYRLWANLVEDGTFTEGEWKVNFRMSGYDKVKGTGAITLEGLEFYKEE